MSLATVTEKFAANIAQAGSLGATVKFVTTEGVVFIDGNSLTVDNTDRDANCTVSMEMADLMDMLNGNLNPMNAFMGGKMRIDGDMSVAMKLQSLLG